MKDEAWCLKISVPPAVWKALTLILRQSCCRSDGLEALLEDASQDSFRILPQCCCCNVEQILCSLKGVHVDHEADLDFRAEPLGLFLATECIHVTRH